MRRKPFLIGGRKGQKQNELDQSKPDAPILFKSESQNALTVYVYDVIDDWWGFSVPEFASELAKMGELETITVRINSPGGDAFAGLAMYNLLAQHDAEVIVKVDGLAASAASVIALAGDKIIMGMGSEMMIHYPWVLAIGNSSDLEKVAADLKIMDDSFVTFYSEHSNVDEKEVAELLKAETFMTAEACVDQGFAHEVSKKSNKETAAKLKVPAMLALDAYKQRNALDRRSDDYSDLAKLERRVASQRMSLARRKLRQSLNQAA